MTTALTDLHNAKFRAVDDAQPVTAGVFKKSGHTAEHVAEDLGHWDPNLHPRNPNSGEFIDKGTSVAKLGKALKINTKVIYGTSYQHGQVVAVQKTPHGAIRQLRWNAHAKVPGSGTPGRFEIWSDYGDSSVPLAQSHIMGKGQAYSELKNESGWYTPATPSVGDMTDVLAQLTLLTSVPSLPPVSKSKTDIMSKFTADDVPSYDIEEKLGVTGLQELEAQVDHLGKYDFQTWLYDHIYPQSWEAMTSEEKQHLTSWANIYDLKNVLNDLVAGGSGNVDEHGKLLPDAGLDAFKHDAAAIADLKNGPLSKDLLENFIESVTPQNWQLLDDTTKVKIGDQAIKYGVVDDLYFAGTGKGNYPAPQAPQAPLMSPSSTAAPKYDTSKIKNVAAIGVPKTGVATTAYQNLTKQSAHTLQQDMLKHAGKKWSSAEVSAISEYTTSVGYQTTNAIMRNDTKRMAMFHNAQLEAGLSRAGRLQEAMTPLTKSVLLHRGVGAQAFGFSGDKVSIGELKKLEGSTITDPAFLSTSVVEPKSSGVGFDYATKKQIKMIIRAPEGTPAVYVSSATPGYSHENELILGAGTTLHLDSIQSASAEDKKKYGSSIEHIVVATVVPSPNAGQVKPPQVSQPKAPAAPNVGPSLVNGGVGTGVPIKLNTNVIHVQKYQDGQIVAVRQPGTGLIQQLYWDGKKNKYALREGITGSEWTIKSGWISKKEAYDSFKNDTNWFAPHPGSTIHDEKIPNTYAGAGAATTAQVKTPKLSVADIQNQHGIVPQLPGAEATNFIQNVKIYSPMGTVKLGSTAPTLFKALAYAVSKHNHDNPNSPQLNLLQGVKLLDAKSAPHGQNTGLYETKIVDWLQTAGGKKNAQAFVDWAHDEAVKSPLVMESMHKFKDAYEIGAPNANVVNFTSISPGDASKMHAEMRKTHGMWDQEQKNALQAYTGSGYGSINQSLRAGKPSKNAALIQSAMAPATRSFTVHRGTDGVGEALKSTMTLEQLQEFKGKVVSDPAFLSTSVGNEAAFTGKAFVLDIDVPEGTPVAYAAAVSSHTSEREMLLAGGLKYVVTDIVSGKSVGRPSFKWVVKMKVVP